MLVQFPVLFSPVDNTTIPADETTIARWVLEYPYLCWMPGSNSCPTMTFTTQLEMTQEVITRTCDILGVLGRGGFGVVFLGELPNGGRVAIKLPRQRITDPTETSPDRRQEDDDAQRLASAANSIVPRFGATDKEEFLMKVESRRGVMQYLRGKKLNQEIICRFRRESDMLRRIDHPNVVRVLHVGEVILPSTTSTTNDCATPPEQPLADCIVMDYLVGTKAQVMISGQGHGQLEGDLPRILLFGKQTALGVAAIHDHGSPHRDLSWHNVVVLGETGEAVVVDLGNVMGVTREQSIDLETFDWQAFGIPGFIAPEQQSLLPVPESDQFSLGVMLYYWCTGGFPFDPQTNAPNDANGPVSIANQCRAVMLNWSVLAQRALNDLSPIVMRAIETRPADRHASMRDMAARLESILIDLGKTSRKPLSQEEVMPVGWYLDQCVAIKVRGMFEQKVSGSLLLQSFVRQCRIQIARSIGTVVEVVDDILSSSDDLDLHRQMSKTAELVEVSMIGLITVLREIDRVLKGETGTKPQVARFGIGLQKRIAAIINTAGDLHAAARDRLPKLNPVSGRPTLNRPANDEQAEALEFFRMVRRSPTELGNHDFELAVYSLELQKLVASLPRNPKNPT